ncbi:hypothetical protein N474_01295 [Pseudoalteromonas luteoviolacea CPMOR-2]|uniref:Peptidase S9 prolyl oligopeptidase catalytic domain-containing protein n=1 Tax=Pseudoalteromonas luteoviolacea DSM 6061 TaxID=1365250 RepID=A0A161XXA2_9GAMM|nr:prolyl oligopeptidase family serine peptidase [Pseudoalteromonas luteoviolacea]KZN38138.1 hypothetical protein N475_16035 [Pseudoalteromonas luteoviolacea DSM 6061]KZN54376.1 hypothetical protein N474_01295 [Pseudoalteromonas luteoviolacea CPMOR-2]MBE0388837.1 hypothetical protein [Pseudoalteromonas luteoviolacea DSM 6061]
MKQFFVACCIFIYSSIAQAGLIDSQKLLTAPEYAQFALSPDGDNVTYIQRAAKSYLIVNYNVKEEAAVAVKNVHHSNMLLDKYWINNDVLFFELEGKRFDHSFIAKKTQSGKFKEVRLDKYWTVIRGYKGDGKHILISEWKRNTQYQVSLVQIESLFSHQRPKKKVLFTSNYGDGYMFYESSVDQLIGYKSEEKEVTVSSRSLEGSKWVPLLTMNFEERDFFAPIGFLDNRTMVVLSNRDSDKISVYKYSLDDKKISGLIYGNNTYDVTDARIEEGRVVSVTYMKHGKPHHEYLSKEREAFKGRLSKELEGQVLTTLDIDQDRNSYLLHASSPTHAGTWYHFNSVDNKFTRLISAYEELESYKLASTQLIKATSKDGIKLEGWLTQPRVNNRNTLIVMPHGGPIGVQDSNEFRHEIQLLANRGFTVLRVNFRGSSGYGKEFQKLGVGALGGEIESDILTVIDKVNEQYSFKHTCAMGASYGGYSSVMLAINESQRFDCVVAAYGIYDIPYLFSSSNFHGKEEFQSKIEGAVGSKEEASSKPSPVYLASKLNVPIFLIAGRRDYVAHFEHSNRFKQVLDMHNKDVETLFFKKVGHGQSQWYRQRQETLAVIDFLERKLNLPKLVPDSDDEKEILTRELIETAEMYYAEDVLLEPNYKLAMHFNKQAAEQGSAEGLYNLGLINQYGKGVETDLEQAREYFQQSSELGYRDAKVALAKMYFHGIGVERETDKVHDILDSITEITEHQQESLLRLMLYCQAPKSDKHQARCLDYPKDFVKKFEQGTIGTLARLIVSAETPQGVKDNLIKFVSELYEINDVKFKLNTRKMGTYVWSRHPGYGWRDKLVPVEDAEVTMDNTKQCYLEAFVDLEGFDGGKRTAAIMRWEAFKDGKLEDDSYTLYRGKTSKAWQYAVSMKEGATDLLYKVSVFNLHGELVDSFECNNN